MGNIATEISYDDNHGDTEKAAQVGFRPLVKVMRNSPCQQSSINSVSHQGLDSRISSVYECGIYRLHVKRTSLLCEPSPFEIESPRHKYSDQNVDQNVFKHQYGYQPLLSC